MIPWYEDEQEYKKQKDENISMGVDFEHSKNDSWRQKNGPLVTNILIRLYLQITCLVFLEVLTMLEFKKKD